MLFCRFAIDNVALVTFKICLFHISCDLAERNYGHVLTFRHIVFFDLWEIRSWLLSSSVWSKSMTCSAVEPLIVSRIRQFDKTIFRNHGKFRGIRFVSFNVTLMIDSDIHTKKDSRDNLFVTISYLAPKAGPKLDISIPVLRRKFDLRYYR